MSPSDDLPYWDERYDEAYRRLEGEVDRLEYLYSNWDATRNDDDDYLWDSGVEPYED